MEEIIFWMANFWQLMLGLRVMECLILVTTMQAMIIIDKYSTWYFKKLKYLPKMAIKG
jgi:hypothetical protein